ncbi:MAG TPA: ABC transporter ATP-binding protein [Gemmataceae bacterium]|nr:ABC transporter ATP-binding protein [Gemmataceae bacterium]
MTRIFGDGDEEVVAVNDVSLDLFPREIALLMGPSGSGKSTLVAVLSGLLRPTSGQVQILGEELWALSERGRQRFRLEHFGFIFQGFNLFPGLTARQQLEIVLRWGRGLSQRQACQRARELLGALGLQEHAARIPEQLSGGEKQRVAVARALVKAPNVCFADEPTSALDWEHGRQVVELLREAAHTRNAAVLIVAHDARLIPYADRLYYLEDGRLCDASAQLSSAPAAPALSIQNLQEACHERLHHP